MYIYIIWVNIYRYIYICECVSVCECVCDTVKFKRPVNSSVH